MHPLPGFTDYPRVACYPNGYDELLADLTYTDIHGMDHVIPKGFLTNGADVPRLLWFLIGHPRDGHLYPCAVVHDWYCVEARRLLKADHLDRARQMRLDGDRLFAEILRRADLPLVKVWAMYRGVRLWAAAGGLA